MQSRDIQSTQSKAQAPLSDPSALEQFEETSAESGQERKVDERVERHVYVRTQN